MKYEEFCGLVSKIFTYFQKRDPDQKVLDLWYQDCSNLKAEARETIFEYFKKLDKFPTNFCFAVKQGYSSFTHKQQAEKSKCSECGDVQYRRYYLHKKGYWFGFWANCPKCNDSPTCRKMNDILRMGGVILPLEYGDKEEEFLQSKGISKAHGGRNYHFDESFYHKGDKLKGIPSN